MGRDEKQHRWSKGYVLHHRMACALRVGSALLVTIGCDRKLPTQSRPKPTLGVSSATVALSDPTMGSLSSLARHVSMALQSDALRKEVHDSMSNPNAMGAGLDLQECDQPGVAQHLLRSGELVGGGSAAELCATIRRMDGLSLYMDPGRLQRWDPKLLPIVTAIADPNKKLPTHFLGYRSARYTIDLPANGSLKGPLLVILPLKHQRRIVAGQRPNAQVRVIQLPTDTSRRQRPFP